MNYASEIDQQGKRSEQQVQEPSKSLSEDKIRPVKSLSNNQRYYFYLNREKSLNKSNFITLGKISEEEKIGILKIEFRLDQERKISLKKYYESTDPCSLFPLRG